MSNQKYISLKVEGMDCIGCAKNIEQALKKVGVTEARVNFSTKELVINDTNSTNKSLIEKTVSDIGYSIVNDESQKTSEKLDTFFLVFSSIVALYFMAQMFFPHDWKINLQWFDWAIATPVLAIGWYKFGKGAIKSALAGMANMYVLILLGATTAYIFSIYLIFFKTGAHLYFEATAVIIALILVGHKIENTSIKKATSALSNLAVKQIQDVKIVENGAIKEVSINDLVVGNIVQINEGNKIPTDGIIVSGQGRIDEALLTGESEPISKLENDEVYGGAVALAGNFQYKVTKTGSASTLSKINELVQKASSEKANIQKYADKISAIFVPTIVAIAVAAFLLNYFGLNVGLEESIMRSVATLVISCPCAMGLATPVAVMVGLGKLSGEGILAKSSEVFENLAKIENLLLDKTGTITTGDFKMENFEVFGGLGKEQIQSIIKAIEQKSSHPIANSIVKQLEQQSIPNYESLISIEEVKGKGMQATDNNNNSYLLGNGELTSQTNKNFDIFLTQNNELLAAFNIVDEMKDNVQETLHYFKEQHIEAILLSGDNERKVAEIANQLHIQSKFGLKPEDKLLEIERYIKKPTAMVGDGINDAPALSKVNVGISFSEASNLAIQSSDVILLNNDFEKIAKAHKIALHTVKTIKQNLFWAFAYNLVAIPLAVFGVFSPMFAAFAMLFSDLVVIGNAYLLKLKKIT